MTANTNIKGKILISKQDGYVTSYLDINQKEHQIPIAVVDKVLPNGDYLCHGIGAFAELSSIIITKNKEGK